VFTKTYKASAILGDLLTEAITLVDHAPHRVIKTTAKKVTAEQLEVIMTKVTDKFTESVQRMMSELVQQFNLL